jgi:hypothetical protein
MIKSPPCTFISLFFFIVFITISFSSAQQPVSDSTQESGSFVFLPILYSSPETGLAYGAMAQYNFRAPGSTHQNRPSVIMPIVVFTEKSQFVGELSYDLYFKNEQHHFFGNIGYLIFPLKFWGIGNDAPDHLEEGYTPTDLRSTQTFLTKISAGMKVGLRYDFLYSDISKTDSLLNQPGITGRKGGVVSGSGLVFHYDTRDNVYWPATGFFHQVSTIFYHSALGSDFNYTVFNIDLRKYQEIYDDHIFAVQAYFNFINGSVPFYKMSFIGGTRYLRGFYEGRYRDHKIMITQAEYRSPTWYNIGMVAFAGLGDVAPQIKKFALNDTKYSFGVGLRYRIDPKEKLNVRADFGFADGGMEFYMQIAEAF